MLSNDIVNLRGLKFEDERKILKWVNNPRLKELVGTVFPISEIEHRKWFENKNNQSSEKTLVIENKDEKALGIVGLKNIDYINSNAEIYIYIGEEEYLGQGLGTKTLELILDFAFYRLNLHRLYLNVFSYNRRAIKSYEKLGFKVEGHFQENLFMSGKYHDTFLMAILNPAHNK